MGTHVLYVTPRLHPCLFTIFQSKIPRHMGSNWARWTVRSFPIVRTNIPTEHNSGQYDHSYLTYIRSLLSLLSQYGMVAFVSMHQDVWSRYSGGSGAPAWTLEYVGFDLDALEETGAAWLNGVRKGGAHRNPTERGLWPTGYTKLAASTMAYVISSCWNLFCASFNAFPFIKKNTFLGWWHVCTQTEGQERCWKGGIRSGISAGHIFGYVRQARGSGGWFGFGYWVRGRRLTSFSLDPLS